MFLNWMFVLYLFAELCSPDTQIVLNTQKNPYLNQATPKILQSSVSLEMYSTTPWDHGIYNNKWIWALLMPH